MGDKTGIEWTEATWNPTVGCARVSPGCDNCYAERQSATRLRRVPAYQGLTVDGKWTGEFRQLPDRLEQPLRWRRPRKIFVNSMSDLFAPEMDSLYIARVFAVMSLAPQHTFQVLTKRPKGMAGLLADPEGDFRYKVSLARKQLMKGKELPPPPPWPYPNVWLGTSIETQAYGFRAGYLLETPAAVRFVSAEPLLGPLDLAPWLTEGIDWVIVGGESGPAARPMHPEWALGLRDQCQATGVAFLFKQWGEWVPRRRPPFVRTPPSTWLFKDGTTIENDTYVGGIGGPQRMWRVGKHEAGRELDGRTWDEYPA